MAGGKGTRLKPLTNVIPKPLIPIGDKTIVEKIMDRFMSVGCRDFYFSVNYKAETIRHYFDTIEHKDYEITYFKEDKPLGTAGSLYLIRDKIETTFFVSNCDIIIDEDYSEILKYHRENKNELTIVAALKHYSIPYGTIKTGDNGLLIELIEKPELTFQINSGMYIMEPHLLSEIPENVFFHITHLIENIKKRNGKIGVFPVSEGSWKDIGERDMYLSFLKRI
jgi:NDP-sugar pyrophosphorylase family protein